MIRPIWAALTASAALFLLAPAADAATPATLSVDDDGTDCPTATYSSVQDAIDAANPGDVVTICPGTYVEGSGAPGTNGLTISKNLTLKGAGADLVKIQPKRTTTTGGQIAAGPPVVRDGVGNLVAAVGGSAVPITVDISGVTIDGNGVYSEVGVLYLDAKGSISRSRVTRVVTSEDNNADTFPGGYRSNNLGYGIAQVTAAGSPPPGNSPRPLLLDNVRVDKYNKLGVLIDGATNDNPPLNPSGVVNQGTIRGSSIIGRTLCINFAVNGNCSTVGLLTTGPTFGQDGLRVTAGSTATVTDTIFSQNLVNGTGAPLRSTNTVPNSTNNANLSMAAGARFIGAGASTITRSNIVDNAYGVYNVGLDGSTPNTGTRVTAEDDWWGLRYTGVTNNPGPAISPTSNPPVPENPVNGSPIPDATCITTNLTTVSNSDAVDFCPFRNGTQGDPNTGEWPVVNAPLPVSDAGPSVDVTTDSPTYGPGDTVTVSATASDDFGVKNVTFYEDGNALAIDSSSPYSTQVVIPADGCGTHTFTAVAKDSANQTATDSVPITVSGPDNCAPAPGAPMVDFVNPPSTIPPEGVTVTANATAEAGVDQVEFFLGNRSLCVDTTPPYTCEVLPNGDEVGDQVLRAIVTDSADQTDEASVAVTVERFSPEDLTITMAKERLSNKRVKRTIRGELVLPDRVTPAQGCQSGTVTLNVQRNGITLFPSAQVQLKSDCRYQLQFTAKEKRHKKYTYDVGASFGGNAVLEPISTTGRFS